MRHTNPLTRLYLSSSARAKYTCGAVGLLLLYLLGVLFLSTDTTHHKAAHAEDEIYIVSEGIPLFNADASSSSSSSGADRAFATVNRSADEKCGAWSSAIFQPNEASGRTTWKKVDLLDNGLVQTSWEHQRSQAPSAIGVIHASAFYSTKTCKREESEDFLTGLVTKEAVLCTPSPEDHVKDSSRGSTMVLSLTGFTNWEDAIQNNPVNLWHYHAVVFRFWVGLQIASHVAMANGLKASYDWIVILLPKQTWALTEFGSDSVFVPSPENLLASAIKSRNRTTNVMVALQGLTDAFGGRVVLASDGVTVGQLRAVLEDNNAPVDIGMWVNPPEDGLMWDLAWDQELSQNLADCRNSILLQYRKDMLGSVKSQRIPEVSRHVCIVSRQGRDLRNLSPQFMLQLLGRLGAPLLLSPRTSLRTAGNLTHGFPLNLEKSSISGQMRFVNQECAVLLGVHGAGLTNALGLRPGTSVIELQTRNTYYQYFRNVAALMEDVDYNLVRITGSGKSGKVEFNMFSDEKGLQELYDLIQTKLEDSMRRQAIHQDK